MKHSLYMFLCMAETILWRKKERSIIWAVQMDNLRDLFGIKRMDKISNARIREVDERIDERVLRCFGHVERMETDGIAKTIYVGECASSHSVESPRKR